MVIILASENELIILHFICNYSLNIIRSVNAIYLYNAREPNVDP